MTLDSIDFDHGPPMHIVVCADETEHWIADEEIVLSTAQWIRRQLRGIDREVSRELACAIVWLGSSVETAQA